MLTKSLTNEYNPLEQEDFDVLTEETPKKSIVLYNDEVNTFDHVINCLVSICEHEVEQAEQCAIIVHYKGKCDVKSGSYEELEPKCSALLNKGLSAEIE